MTTRYNDRDQPIGLLFHDPAGRELSRVEYVYDDAGHLVEEAQMKSEDSLPAELLASLNQAQQESIGELFGIGRMTTQRTHKYDGRGRRVETCSLLGRIRADVKTVVYNDWGDRIHEVFENNGQEYGIGDDGRILESATKKETTRSEARFVYDYDPHGNWVSKTVESRAVRTGNTR